jgi:Arc/MetJ-type ribon-helix-helix transcriptional regulator
MGFRKISIHEELITAIEKVMEETGTYRSIAEFVSEAVRLRLEQLAKREVSEDPPKKGCL